jgi:hypothetical protein
VASSAEICTYCLKPTDDPTYDHVLPEAWYTKDTVGSKPTVLAGRDCNEAHGRSEAELLKTLGFCFGFGDTRALGIGEKVARSVNPAAGKNPKDIVHRAAAHRKLGTLMIPAEKADSKITIPGFGADPTNPSRLAITVSGKNLLRLSEKMARGFTRIDTGALIGNGYAFSCYLPCEDELLPILEMIEPGGSVFDRLPSLRVVTLREKSDPLEAIFAFQIWSRRLNLIVSVEPRSGWQATGTAPRDPQ